MSAIVLSSSSCPSLGLLSDPSHLGYPGITRARLEGLGGLAGLSFLPSAVLLVAYLQHHLNNLSAFSEFPASCRPHASLRVMVHPPDGIYPRSRDGPLYIFCASLSLPFTRRWHQASGAFGTWTLYPDGVGLLTRGLCLPDKMVARRS